jgi:hypothetical protein
MHTDIIRQRLAELGWQGTLLVSDDEAPVDPVFGENKGDFILDYEKGVFEQEIKAVVDAESPDHLFFHLTGDTHNLRFLQDAQRAGFQGDVITCGMARSLALLDPDQNGDISEYLENRLYFAMRAPIPSADLDAFNTRYKEKYANFRLDEFTPSVYDAMMLVGLAVVDAHPEQTGAAVRDSIVKVSREGKKHTFKDVAARSRTRRLGWTSTTKGRPVRWILAISASRRGVFTWKWRSRRAMAAAGNTRS